MKPYNTPNMASYKAGEDLSGNQYRFVKVGTVVNTVVAIDSAADIPIGIQMDAPAASGDPVSVAMIGGGAKLICDANVNGGEFIGTGADGKGEPLASTSGSFVAAIADSTSSGATSANDVIPVYLVAFEAAREAQDIMTTQGDIIQGGVAGVPERLAVGTSGQFLTTDGTSVSWGSPSYGAGSTLDDVVGINLRDVTTVAYTLNIRSVGDGGTPMAADRQLSIDVYNAARNIDLQGDVDLAGDLSTAGAVTFAGAYTFTCTLEDANTAVTFDNVNLEFESTDASQRTWKFTSAKAGNTTVTLEENFSIGDGFDVSITAEDASTTIVMDNCNFEVENTDATQRALKFTLAATAARTWTLPDADDTLVGLATTDTLTNKSIDSDNNTITNIVDADVKATAAIATSKLAGSVHSANAVALLPKMARARFDYSDQTGSGAHAIFASTDIPDNSIIIGGFIDVLTTFEGDGDDSSTLAIHVEGANDIVTASPISGAPWSSVATVDIIPDMTGSAAVKCSAARDITATVAILATDTILTQGSCDIYLFYVAGS